MLLRHSALYILANVVAAALGFLGVMVLTRLVAPAEYGVYVVVMSAGTVLSTIFFTWQRHAILRYQSEQSADVRLSVLAGYLLTLAVHPLALLILVHALRMPLNKATAAVLIAAAGAFFELGQELLRARQSVPAYVRGAVLRSCLTLGFCLVAALSNAGGIGLAAAVIASYVVSALLSIRHVWAAPREPMDLATLKRLARYGLPITLSGAFVALTLALDRFVLYALVGTETVGIYGATADFVRQCAILPAMSASIALAPIAIASLRNDPSGNDTMRRHLIDGAELLIAVALPVAIGLSIAAPQVAGTILGSEYRALAERLIPILAFAFIAHCISQQYVQLSFGLAEAPRLYIVHTGSIFVINLTMMVPLVWWLGATGAAISLLVSEFAGVGIGVILARRAYPLPRLEGRLGRVVLSALVMAGVSTGAQILVDRTDALGLLVVVAAGVASYVAAAIALNVARLRPAAMALVANIRLKVRQTES